MSKDSTLESGRQPAGLLTASEVATHLHLDHCTVRKMIRSGVLPCVWIGTNGRMLRIKPEDLEIYIENQAVAARAEPLVTVPVAAKQMGLNALLLKRAHKQGELHFYVIGSWPRVRMSDVYAWLDSKRHQRPARQPQADADRPGLAPGGGR